MARAGVTASGPAAKYSLMGVLMAELLDELSQGCADGDLVACDALYELSPQGSDYEAFGATCGGRVSQDYADECSGQA